MAKILVIRLSAIGDVALTIPVLYSVARAYPDDSFTILTQIFLLPVFINRPANLDVIGINTKGPERSTRGFLRFARAYSRYDFDMVIDLHRVIRTRIISLLFRLAGKKVYGMNKARCERRRLVSQRFKVLQPLRPVTERYADVFRRAGFDFGMSFRSLFDSKPAENIFVDMFPAAKRIGIAPFAKHPGKVYPPDKMEAVIAGLSRREQVGLYLFGSRGSEQKKLEEWAARYPRTCSVAGKYSLDNELRLISNLDVLLCMDSANMHFASLVETPIVSVWGATHPFAGFYPYRRDFSRAVQLELPCRPCSIYGSKPCRRKDFACMTLLPPSKIIAMVEEELFPELDCKD
ncbi:MAG: glycosyltransferase family 9 protein [Tannerellaceae bacterium]|jgi:ADP-heptose:LPS heptosyltransferase|nr:glycosyltransferase family 9 protein [Tannerellaceae bacterium]